MAMGKVIGAVAAAPVYKAEKDRRNVNKGVDAAVEDVVGNLLGTNVDIDNSPSVAEKLVGGIAAGVGMAKGTASARGHEFDAMTSAWKHDTMEDTAEFE